MPKDPSTVYQGKKSLRLYNIEGAQRLIKGHGREPMHPEQRKLLQRELGLIKAGRWDVIRKDKELMAEFDIIRYKIFREREDSYVKNFLKHAEIFKDLNNGTFARKFIRNFEMYQKNILLSNFQSSAKRFNGIKDCINQTTTNGEKVCIPNEQLGVIENIKDAISQLEIFFNETIPSNYENPGVMYEKIEEIIAFVQDMCKMVDFRQISDKKVHHRIYYEFDNILSILQRFEKEIYFMATKLIPKEAFDFFHNQGITQFEAEGADGQVYTMNFPSHTYALKTALRKGVGMKKYMDRFLDLDHINVLKYKYCLQTEENIDPRTSTGIPNAVMMEHCIESLANYINDHERYISRYFYLAWAFGIVDGMEYLHYYHIIHRDLKPDNILLDYAGMIKIADLDRATSKLRKDNLPMSVMGSYRYTAPEYLAPSHYKIPIDKKIDVWSYGVILWQMFTRKRPYDCVKNDYAIWYGMYQKLIGESNKYPQLDILPETPEPLKLLIQKCLAYKAEDRVTFDYIVENFVPPGRSIITTSEGGWKEITRQKCGIESADKQYEHYTATAIAKFLNRKEDKNIWSHKQLMEDICRMIN